MTSAPPQDAASAIEASVTTSVGENLVKRIVNLFHEAMIARQTGDHVFLFLSFAWVGKDIQRFATTTTNSLT